MTLRARLALGFLTIAILLAVPLAASFVALKKAHRAAKELGEGEIAASLFLARVRSAAGQLRQAEASIVVNPGDTLATKFLEREAQALGLLAEPLHHYGQDSVGLAVRTAAAEIRQFARIEAAAYLDGQDALGDRISSQHVVGPIIRMEERVGRAEEALRERAKTQVDRAADAAGDAVTVAGILLALALAVSAVVAAWITRTISRPVRDLELGMEAVAGGKFTHQLTVAPGRDDEFGRLAASFQSMTDQLAELDKLKAEFVSVASHELKTPINVIMGYLKLLEENLYGPMSERQTEVVNIMQTQANSLGRLVQHLLDVSRFQAGAARLEARPTNLRGFLSSLEGTYEVLAMQREVTFSVVTSDGLPEVVTWDVDRINEVLGNLLSNAFKFTEAGGRVDLVVSSLEDSVYIEVRDTGVGIDAAQLPHIFDKFFQADNQKSAGAKGSGLGLAISKEIVEAHGGSIAAESAVGKGTKFSIMLPVSAVEHTPSETTAAARDAATDAAPSPAAAGASA